MAAEPLVLRVFGVDAHGGVAHDGLGTRGGYDGVVAFFIAVDDIALLFKVLKVLKVFKVLNVVFQVVELRALFFVFYLLGREGGEGLGVPVDHAESAVDEAFVVEVDEDAGDALAAGLVHGEGCAIPIAAGTELAELLQDDAAMLVGPLPGMLEELLAGEVVLFDALLGEGFHHLSLGGDGGVVGAGDPAGVLALHAGTADYDVLDGVVEHVAHVQHAGDIGRRDDDGVGHAVVGLRVEEFLVEPELVPFLLDGTRVVFRSEFHYYFLLFLFVLFC